MSDACVRCGADLPQIEVTTYGDLAEGRRRYVSGVCGCPDPRPHCCFCHRMTHADGRCQNIDCFLVGHVVPIPRTTGRTTKRPPPTPLGRRAW